MNPLFDFSICKGFSREEAASEIAEIAIQASRFNLQLSVGDNVTQEFLARDADRQTLTKQYASVAGLVSYAAQAGIGYLHIMQLRKERYDDNGMSYVSKIVSFAV